jgi:hypothetical protein
MVFHKMKPHLKVGSYFIYSYNHTDAAGGSQTTYRSVSFKIINILWSKELILGIIEKLVTFFFQSSSADKSCFQLFQQAIELLYSK